MHTPTQTPTNTTTFSFLNKKSHYVSKKMQKCKIYNSRTLTTSLMTEPFPNISRRYNAPYLAFFVRHVSVKLLYEVPFVSQS